jgi:pyrroloquinoline quinone biosynthesis protein D
MNPARPPEGVRTAARQGEGMPMRCPKIAPMYRLQWEVAQDAWVLLYPEGMVQLNGPAGEILQRCNGQRTVDELITELQHEFGEADLRADVIEFLGDARARGWLH